VDPGSGMEKFGSGMEKSRIRDKKKIPVNLSIIFDADKNCILKIFYDPDETRTELFVFYSHGMALQDE
jgi:hypothetical protein